ncbi:MAG: DoxX family protein [Bacteroidota bacterium]
MSSLFHSIYRCGQIAGAAAILIPGYPGVKEWAYAGLLFDLVGATYSIIASGQSLITGFSCCFLLVWVFVLIYSISVVSMLNK